VATAIWRQFVTSVRLQVRNPTALAYSFAIPLVFLGAFWTLYRHESPPLGRHLGQLLTITALGGACFAVPAWLVSDRERGVWRRYRLTPMPGVVHLVGILGASYLLMLAAGVLQIAAAALIGTPIPSHPVYLWLAFTLAAAAFLGLGLLITMIGDTVPAAQAIGQVMFLPMLILGGVAVPLESLPGWVQRVAAALPGRHAVDAIEGALTGSGFDLVAPAAAALTIMTAASGLSVIALFRWESGQRIGWRRAVAPIGLVLASWVAVGAIVKPASTRELAQRGVRVEAAPAAIDTPAGSSALPREPSSPGSSFRAKSSDPPSAPPPPAPVQRTWRDVTLEDVNVNVVFVGLPPDHGVVTPITGDYRPREDVECVRRALSTWPPAGIDDVVQRSRNVLLLAAVPDVLQLDIEHDMPVAVFEHLQQKIPREQLVQVLYWIATHPFEGDLAAIDQLAGACLDVQPPDAADVIRERIGIYATKLLGRITGKIR
jgi:hypothetical protein